MTTMRSPNLDADSIHATVMRVMLRRPNSAWKLNEIAGRVGLGITETSRVLEFLLRRGFIRRSTTLVGTRGVGRIGWMLTSLGKRVRFVRTDL